MNEQDRQAIEGLFSRLLEAEKQAGPRDANADAFIQQRIGEQPGAPYMMAQTIVMQNYALEQAQQRISELEAQSAANQQAPATGAGLVGGSRPADNDRRPGMVPVAGQRANPAAGNTQPPPIQPQTGGGGFLAGAAQTAMGVAGGMMLGSALGGMFGGSSAEAAPAATPADAAPADAAAAQPDPVPAEPAPEPEAEEGGGGFFDSIFGGGDDSDF
jgi:hypothetical protein